MHVNARACAWASVGIFQRRKIFWEGATFEIDDTGANGAENKNRTAQSVNTLICFTFLKQF